MFWRNQQHVFPGTISPFSFHSTIFWGIKYLKKSLYRGGGSKLRRLYKNINTHRGRYHLSNAGGKNSAWWHHCVETLRGLSSRERGFRNTGESWGRAVSLLQSVLNAIDWKQRPQSFPSRGCQLTTTTTSVSPLRCHLWRLHRPTFLPGRPAVLLKPPFFCFTHSPPLADFFMPQHHRLFSQDCSGDRLQHADRPASRLSAVVSTVDESQRGKKKMQQECNVSRSQTDVLI